MLNFHYAIRHLKLDHFGFLPGAFNGNIPMLIMAGRCKEEVVLGPNGKPEIRPMMTLCYSFDERIEDGLYGVLALDIMKSIMENPASH